MRSIRIPLAVLLLASTIVGCGLVLGVDDYQQVCEAPGCRACAEPTDCGEPPLCSFWTCEANVCTQRPSAAHTTCPLGICDGDGKCVGCISADNCGTTTECEKWTCAQRICTRTLVAAGTPVVMQADGDCKQSQCDGKGGEISVIEAQGTPCMANGGKLCDDEGICVQCMTHADCTPSGSFCDPGTKTCFRCNDGKKNGDETDIDCGGNFCFKCVQGKTCATGGHCTTGYCADGICCNDYCVEPCKACNVSGSVGLCDAIPKYGEDLYYGNGETCLHADGLACPGGGACASVLGTPCLVGGDCASGKCGDPDGDGQKTCVKGPFDPCIQPVECYNNTCVTGICPP